MKNAEAFTMIYDNYSNTFNEISHSKRTELILILLEDIKNKLIPYNILTDALVLQSDLEKNMYNRLITCDLSTSLTLFQDLSEKIDNQIETSQQLLADNEEKTFGDVLHSVKDNLLSHRSMTNIVNFMFQIVTYSYCTKLNSSDIESLFKIVIYCSIFANVLENIYSKQ